MTTIEQCALICERPFFRLAPSMSDIDPNSHEPLDRNISQRDLFSFINEAIKIRAEEIRQLEYKQPFPEELKKIFE